MFLPAGWVRARSTVQSPGSHRKAWPSQGENSLNISLGEVDRLHRELSCAEFRIQDEALKRFEDQSLFTE
ncbi:MAG: hypothetical protein CL936_09505 [Deltaproteobacteria bacterium]|nr:hypothetical protein [Deltaproteobacteria bacterium]